MKFIIFLLFVLIIGAGIIFLMSYYEQKISTLHRELVISKNQFSKLKLEYKKLDSFKNNCSITFLNLDQNYGIVSKDSILHLSPNEISPILQKLSIAMEVRILEKVLSDDFTWYYIALPLESNINSRGWVLESCFSNLSSSSTDVIKC
ncbi:hypothetical protein [Clostridium uliginosum]|uniref:SH3 domain-containing protein n=1 Tax=Clostridium uliginosum TaxID=119641 RepID=A0A1I1SHT7_9CLOT|nr:hypothetical protein [Clostridium uliginosum]SFD43413.1 hypothetical protein SAMN05421842_14811 [Clostridium uliginosum]